MYDMKISDSVVYVGVDDKDIDLFESQYKVPNGVTYNSYVILDEKIAVMDTVDKRRTQQWLDNLEKVLDGRKPDYLVVSHLEPDHASNIQVWQRNILICRWFPMQKYFLCSLSSLLLILLQKRCSKRGGTHSALENIPFSSLWLLWSTGRKLW